MKKVLSLIFHLSIFIFSLASQGVQFSGAAGSFWAGAIRLENRGDFLLGDIWLNGKFEAFYNKSSAYAEGRAGFDETENKTYAELKEIYLDYTTDFWSLRAGRQKAAWGKADGIDIVNVLCPKDYSSTRSLFDDEYFAIDSVRFSLNKGNHSLDAYFIPIFTAAELPKEQKAQLSSIELPEKNIKNAEYALKLSGYFSRFDISLYGFYGWEDTPFLDYALKIENGMQTGIKINAGYKKMAMFGADAAIPIGETVLRLEGAFFPKRHFQTAAEKILSDGENTEEHNNLAALAGLDWMREGWTFTAQYFCDCLFGETENLERTRKFEHGTTLSISKSLLSETLKLSASGVLMLKDFDSAIELSGEYSLSDSIFLELGGYIFNEGKETGTYGKYKDYSSIYLKARYVF